MARYSNNLYRKRYAIGIYGLGKDDQCVALFDNVTQLAEYINKSVATTQKLCDYHFNHKSEKPHKINIGNSFYEIAFINMD